MVEEADPDNSKRDTTLIKPCLERDGGRCVLTKAGEIVEVCHVYPFALQKKRKYESQRFFWNRLRMFWSDKQVSDLQKTVEGPDGTEFLGNLICLGSHVHDYWGRACIAFKPISKTEDTLTLEFYWMPALMGSAPVVVDSKPVFPSSLDCAPKNDKLFDCESEEKIVSGHQFTLTTPDPISHPLPSWELMQMQWILQRIARLRGAAVLEDDEDNDDDSESSASIPGKDTISLYHF